VKRGKNDTNDAAAIATAVRQPDMRFVAVKTQEQQARAVLFRTHQTFTRQRAKLMVTLRGHLQEHGVIVAKGQAALLAFSETLEASPELVPDLVFETARLYFHQIEQLGGTIAALERQMAEIAKTDEVARRIQTMPGVGTVNAAALLAFAPAMESFRRGRDFAAWLGLVPTQHSTGGKTRLGRVSRMGQADMRRLLVNGATVCLRWASAKGTAPDSWLGKLMARKPWKVAAIALANKMARALWAMVVNKTDYQGGLITYEAK
jgi:transposase